MDGHTPAQRTVTDWASHLARERDRSADGERRLPEIDDADTRQRQLTRLGNAANGAALCLLMLGEREEAGEWFDRAARRWRESYAGAPPGSWGRPIGAIKARILADDWTGAEAEATWTLGEGAGGAESPIGRYAATLAMLVLGRDAEALPVGESLRGREDFPPSVADALSALAARDANRYARAVAAVLESFETRDEYLEDVPVADTVLVLQALAERRRLATKLSSPLLPG
jgi:hypothetical protein